MWCTALIKEMRLSSSATGSISHIIGDEGGEDSNNLLVREESVMVEGSPTHSTTELESENAAMIVEEDSFGGTVLVSLPSREVFHPLQLQDQQSANIISTQTRLQPDFRLSDVATVESEEYGDVLVSSDMVSAASSLSITPSMVEKGFQTEEDNMTVHGNTGMFPSVKSGEESPCTQDEVHVATEKERSSPLLKFGEIFFAVASAFLIGVSVGQGNMSPSKSSSRKRAKRHD